MNAFLLSHAVPIASIVSLGLLAALLIPTCRAARCLWQQGGRPLRLAWIAALVATALPLARPHRDTAVALDMTGYRLMSEAFAAGSPLVAEDTVFRAVPATLRDAFLRAAGVRPSRDATFQLQDLDRCIRQPFFMPWLPLAAAGLERALGPGARDAFVPFVGWAFICALLTAAVARAGWWGLGAALALICGTPLPAWFFRGFYPEVVATVLIGLVLLDWSSEPLATPRFCLHTATLGLALAFHPLLVVFAAPALLLLAVSAPLTPRRALAGMLAGAAGVAPFVWMTAYVCQPYGPLLLPKAWRGILHEPKLAVVAVLVALVATLLIGVVATPERFRERLRRRLHGWVATPWRGVALLAVALLPLAVAWLLPAVRPQVREGLRDVVSGTRTPWLLLALLLLLGVGVARPRRPWLLGMLLLTTLPVFLYLKGAEPAGFWSQRRWLPPLLLACVALLPSADTARWLRHRTASGRIAVAALILAAMLHNFGRWPAPYTVRSDAGADVWRRELRAELDASWTVFDYFEHGFCFAMDGRTRVLGLQAHAWPRIPEVIAWLRGVAAAGTSPTLATSFAPPGIEDGLRLTPRSTHAARFKRLRARRALPAVAQLHDLRVTLLTATPADPTAPPALHKTLDGGPLALRGPWGDARPLTTASDATVPAAWSREGSGVVGPLPPPGGSVRIVLAGASGRSGHAQTLRVVTPWGEGPALTLPPGTQVHEVSGFATRPAAAVVGAATGIYRLYAERPYDPAAEGLRGYDADLGAQLHAIHITVAEIPASPD